MRSFITSLLLGALALTFAACKTDESSGAAKGESKDASKGGEGLEPNTDRPGNDYKDFDLEQPDPQLCRKACQDEADCKAFVYVNPGVQADKARCWLKNDVPGKVESDCCTAGVK